MKNRVILDDILSALTKEGAVVERPGTLGYDAAMLTKRGWLTFSVSVDKATAPFHASRGIRKIRSTVITFHSRFEIPALTLAGTSKWNHYLESTEDVIELLKRLQPAAEDIPRLEFLGACGRLFNDRKHLFFRHALREPRKKRLRVLGQAGQYSPSMSIWYQPGQESFAEQDAKGFWATVAEFGAGASFGAGPAQ